MPPFLHQKNTPEEVERRRLEKEARKAEKELEKEAIKAGKELEKEARKAEKERLKEEAAAAKVVLCGGRGGRGKQLFRFLLCCFFSSSLSFYFILFSDSEANFST